MLPAVELSGVARRFIKLDGDILTALNGFDLSIAPGEFCAIVGPTGCGKSTTLGLIAGLARPQAGSVQLFGAEVRDVDRRVGLVFQQDAVFPWKNVVQNVEAGPLFRGMSKSQAREMALDWVRRVGLSGFEESLPHQLSGGMRTQGCNVYSQYLFLTWMPSYLQATKGLTIAKTGFYAAIPYAVAVVLCIFVGRISDRLLKGDVGGGKRH
ncbi:ATP-binding cassette domain-containing protein, partial [Bradyrhizobium sp. 179]|uniref:ABC transporter ATP-binding protein n=1 Tax=Bradyrhizobium sp. 179 TaxID=2782648 RepID=UPI001FF7F9EE